MAGGAAEQGGGGGRGVAGLAEGADYGLCNSLLAVLLAC